MLGIIVKRTPVSSVFAEQMKEALERAKTGHFTTVEIEARKRVKEASEKYNVIWQ